METRPLKRYRGVTWHAKDGRWQAALKVGNTSYYLGQFKEQKCAAKAYDAEAKKFGRPLNFPDSKNLTILAAVAAHVVANRGVNLTCSARDPLAFQAKADAVAWDVETLKIQRLLRDPVGPKLFADVECTVPDTWKRVPFKIDETGLKRYRDDCAELAAVPYPDQDLKMTIAVWCRHGPTCPCTV